MRKSITIKDVAKLAGVSTATVSRILNGKGGVTADLSQRVKQAVEELQYRPNETARALKNQATKSIGLIIPDIENPFFPALVRGVSDAAAQYNYCVILCNASGGKPDFNYVEFLLTKQVDGIIYTPDVPHVTPALLEKIHIPFVVLDRKQPDLRVSTVVTDNLRGGYLATRHLLGLGRRHIAFVAGQPEASSSTDRLAGYRQALAEAGQLVDPALIRQGHFTYDGGYRAIEQLLADSIPFDAVFCANDMMAIGAVECLSHRGYKVPETVSVVGFDDILLASLYTPKLTTVRQPIYDMGRAAVKLVLRGIHSKSRQIATQSFPPALVIRESCGGKPGGR